MAKKVAFDEVTIFWEAAYAKEYIVQTSEDSLSWKTIVTQTAGQGGVETYPVQNDCRYVRFYGTKRATEWGYSIYEIELHLIHPSAIKSDLNQNTHPDFRIEQNYPNPFNSSTVIHYTLPRQSQVHMSILNTLGETVCTLDEGIRSEGAHTVHWSGRKQH